MASCSYTTTTSAWLYVICCLFGPSHAGYAIVIHVATQCYSVIVIRSFDFGRFTFDLFLICFKLFFDKYDASKHRPHYYVVCNVKLEQLSNIRWSHFLDKALTVWFKLRIDTISDVVRSESYGFMQLLALLLNDMRSYACGIVICVVYVRTILIWRFRILFWWQIRCLQNSFSVVCHMLYKVDPQSQI